MFGAGDEGGGWWQLVGGDGAEGGRDGDGEICLLQGWIGKQHRMLKKLAC